VQCCAACCCECVSFMPFPCVQPMLLDSLLADCWYGDNTSVAAAVLRKTLHVCPRRHACVMDTSVCYRAIAAYNGCH
jgi:hypothetical protein